MTKPASARHISLFYFLLIIICGITVYANALKGEFLWDDEYLVKKNLYIKSWVNLDKIFTQHIGAGAQKPSNLYRPLQLLSYMVDYSFWKLNVPGYHLSNILLHLAVALVSFWLVYLLFGQRILALLSALFFVVHPVHTEAVAYIAGRADPLAALFMLLTFVFYLKYLKLKKEGFSILVCLSYVFALLSKETSLVLPALIFLYQFIWKKKAKIKLWVSLLVITFVYIILRLSVFNFPLPEMVSKVPVISWQRLPGFLAALGEYLRLLFLPFNLHMEYGQKVFSWDNLKVLLGLAILISLVIFAWRKRRREQVISFGIFWFLLSLLPVSNIYFINAYMAEHWLYLPSMGFFLIAAKAFVQFYQKEKLRILTQVSIVILLGFYAYLTIQQNRYWQEPLAFYERTLKFVPDSARVYLNLANLHFARGERERIVPLYQKAIELDPNFAAAYSNLGATYFDLGKKEKALELFHKALKLDPRYADAYFNLANAYLQLGRQEEALALLQKIIEINPNYSRAYFNLGIEYFKLGRKEAAIELLKKAVVSDPYNGEFYYNLSVAYLKTGNYPQAIKYCGQAQALGYTNPKLLEALKPYR